MDINKLNQQILINVNGELLPREKATITVYESGYLMGDGIWEGIRLIDNKWIFLDEHLDRLFEGLVDIDIELCLLYTSPSPRDGLLSRMPSSA